MLKRNNNASMQNNNTKVKYYLPVHSQQKCKTQNPLNKIKKQISRKYGGSYSSSKTNSKRHSVANIEKRQQNTQNISCSDDLSFQIVDIRDASQQKSLNSQTNSHFKKFRYPLEEFNNGKLIGSQAFNDKKVLLKPKVTQDSVYQNSKRMLNLKDKKDFQEMYKHFPQQSEKQQFNNFLEGLKKDENYQNTVTMFTIMYFYQQTANKKR